MNNKEKLNYQHNDIDFKDRSYQAMQLLAEIYNSKKIYKAEIFTQEFIHKVRNILLDPNSYEEKYTPERGSPFDEEKTKGGRIIKNEKGDSFVCSDQSDFKSNQELAWYQQGYDDATREKDAQIKDIRQALGKEFQDRMYDAAIKTLAPIIDLVSQIKEEKRKTIPFPEGGIVGEKTGGKSALTKDEVEQVISTKNIQSEFMKRAKLAENPILDEYLKDQNAIYHDINIHIALEKFADWQASKGIVTGNQEDNSDELYNLLDDATDVLDDFVHQCDFSDGYITDDQKIKSLAIINQFVSIKNRKISAATSSIFSEQKNAPQDTQIKAAGERNQAYINERSTLPIDEQLIELGQDLAHMTLNAVNVDLAQWLKHQLTPFADRLIKLYRKREKDNGAEMYKVLVENQPKAPTIDDLREAAGIQSKENQEIETLKKRIAEAEEVIKRGHELGAFLDANHLRIRMIDGLKITDIIKRIAAQEQARDEYLKLYYTPEPVKINLDSYANQDTNEGDKGEKGATNKKSSHACGIKLSYFDFLDEYVSKNTQYKDYVGARLWMPHKALNELRDNCDGAYRAYCFHLENKGGDHE